MDEHGFEARLRHLEHVLVGGQQQQQSLLRSNSINNDTKLTLLKRIEGLKKELHSLCKSNKAVHDFVEKYEPHAKQLDPAESTLALEREILSTDTKLELVLAAYDELTQFASQVKQVKSLEHVVNGSDFEAVEKLGPDLSAAEVLHAEQSKQLADLTRKVTVAMENYNGLCNTLSEIFISWDDILSTMEAHISALERQRKEKA